MTTAEQLYKDIIHKSRPDKPETWQRHPRMRLEDRAKIFAPFSALRGLDSALDNEGIKLLRSKRIELSAEEANILADKIAQVKKGMKISVTHFLPDSSCSELGYYTKITGIVTDINLAYHRITMDCGEKRNMKPITTTVQIEEIIDILLDSIKNSL